MLHRLLILTIQYNSVQYSTCLIQLRTKIVYTLYFNLIVLTIQTELISLHKKSHIIDEERSEFIGNIWKFLLREQSQISGSLEESPQVCD